MLSLPSSLHVSFETHGYRYLVEHGNAFTSIYECHVLWCRYDNRSWHVSLITAFRPSPVLMDSRMQLTVNRYQLTQTQLHVACPRRHIYDECI